MRELQVSLQPNQIAAAKLFFKEGPDVATYIGFGGPRGGAKSFGVRALAVGVTEKYPGSRTFIIRKNWTDLYENHYLKFAEDFSWINQYWNGQHKEYTLPNRSTIAYKFADTDREIEQLARGPEAMFHLVDQAEQFSEKQLKLIHTSNRWTRVPIGRCKTGHFFNPGGPGNEYLKRIYYDRKYHAEENPNHYDFIFSKGWENWEWFRSSGIYRNADEFYSDSDEHRFQNFIKHTDYGRNLWEKPESMRLGELYGSFEHFAGQYYGGIWDENVHCLRPGHAEAVIQPWWRRWIAIDWGFAHNAACGWFAAGKLSPQQAERAFGMELEREIEVIICYRELVVKETQETDFAAQVASATPLSERKEIGRTFFSTEAFGVRGSAAIVAPVLRQYGLPAPEPAANQRVTRGVGSENERIGGWRLIYNMLQQTANFSRRPVATGAYSAGPMLLIGGDCPKTQGAIPALMRDPDNPEDVLKMDSEADDIGDCFCAGTLIRMEMGLRPIESIQPSERVWTRDGLRRVVNSWMRSPRPILEARFSNGATILSTGSHRIHTARGFVRLDTLRYDDIITVWDSLSSEEESIRSCQPDTIAPAIGFCTSMFGWKRMGRFLRAARSTIRISTRRIVSTCQTWSVFLARFTENYMAHLGPETLSTWQGYGNSLRLGTHLQLVGNGTGEMLSMLEYGDANNHSFAMSAEPAIGVREAGSAQINVSLNGGEESGPMTLVGFARTAATHSEPVGSSHRRHAADYAVRLAERHAAGIAEVYDLEVEGTPEFYANDILVHNCLRYGMTEYLRPRTKPIAIERQEVYASLEDPSERALKMREFDRNKRVSGVARRGRSWR